MKHVLTILAALAATPAMAATGTNPDWPCVQVKQPHLSLGQVWTGPIPDDAIAEIAKSKAVGDLAARLEQRRLPMDQAEALIAEFAQSADNQHLTALMQAVFAKIEPDRSSLIAGIARYGRRQVELSSMIGDRRANMAKLEAASTPDFDAIDAEEKALDWDQRIFTERQQSLSYVCETPVILEQRAFALGRAIASHLK